MKSIAPQHADGMLDRVLAESRNMLVPWFLMASYLYYDRDVSLLTDARYDLLCKQLDEEWDDLSHRHKSLVDRAALKAGTGFQIGAYPEMVIGAACQLARIPRPAIAPADLPVTPKSKVSFTIKKKVEEPVKKVTKLVFGRKT